MHRDTLRLPSCAETETCLSRDPPRLGVVTRRDPSRPALTRRAIVTSTFFKKFAIAKGSSTNDALIRGR